MNICKGIGKWCWIPTWLNVYSYKESGYKTFRWGYWNLSINVNKELK